MIPRGLVALALAALSGTLPATVAAERSPSFATPTTSTTTTTSPVIVTPTIATTTTTTPVIVAPSTTTTTTALTTTTSPVIVIPTTTTTTAPAIVAPSTTTTTLPSFVAASTTTGIDDLTVVAGEHGPDEPIGQIDTSGALPEGLDLTAFPGASAGPTPAADGQAVTAGLSCAYQCIKSGVAYPRGFGALLTIETYVPAQLFVSVVDENYDAVGATNSTGRVSEFSWALDHLDPGQTYYAMVVATDENGDSAYAYGQIFTLSSRTVEITVDDPIVYGGPTNIVHTTVWLQALVLAFWNLDPPQTVVYLTLPRHVDVVVVTFREWATSQHTVCESFHPDPDWPQGDDDGLCGTWNTASLGNIDLDAIPAGRDRWTSVTVDETLSSAATDDALPDGYGDPRFFDFSAPVTIAVSYS